MLTMLEALLGCGLMVLAVVVLYILATGYVGRCLVWLLHAFAKLLGSDL